MPGGHWEAFMADRFHKQFCLAAQHLEPEELPDSLPMTLPVTHLLEESGGTMFGIAKYPID
eukprot:3551085-Prorocentrum_lima.AAC.1